MIWGILNTADINDLWDARWFVHNELRVPMDILSNQVAVAYICKHFAQGDYAGWDGFVEMLDARRKSSEK